MAQTKPVSMLEFGCGRGELLRAFHDMGLMVRGNDISKYAVANNQDMCIDVFPFVDTAPYSDCSFDCIISKSFIEHLHNPVKYFEECFRILKPGGVLLSLTPDWRSNYVKFFDDYTHVRPFSKISLGLIYDAVGYKGIRVDEFKQLPLLWNSTPLYVASNIIAPFIPQTIYKSKIRWLREKMLIGYGAKE